MQRYLIKCNCNKATRILESSCKFDVHGSVYRRRISKYNQRRCNVTQFIYLCETLYMFQAVPPPIIKSSKTIYTASGTFSNNLPLPATVTEELERSSNSYTTVASSSKWFDKVPEAVYIVFELLMMGVGTV